MLGTYDKKLWEQLAATITAQNGWTAQVLSARADSNSTGAIGAEPSVANTNKLVTMAYDNVTNTTHIMYRYSS